MGLITYKGCGGWFERDADEDAFHGDVLCLGDVMTFQGRSTDELKQALADSIEDCFEACAQFGKEPDKLLGGSLSPRLNPRVVGRIAAGAVQRGVTLDGLAADILTRAVQDSNLWDPGYWRRLRARVAAGKLAGPASAAPKGAAAGPWMKRAPLRAEARTRGAEGRRLGAEINLRTRSTPAANASGRQDRSGFGRPPVLAARFVLQHCILTQIAAGAAAKRASPCPSPAPVLVCLAGKVFWLRGFNR
jgi:predicted HicB family RNase H-like nuclease